ncbi:hypothetical protein ES706_04884 [subsurface metagenome]
MAIELRHLESIRYPPELLPDADVVTVALNARAEIMNIPHIPGNMITKLHGIAADNTQAAQLRIKIDQEEKQLDARPLYNMSLRDRPSYFNLIATKSLRYHVYAIAALTDFTTWYGVWGWKQTVADKLLLKLPLTPNEQNLNERLGIGKTVERGTLPPKLDRTLLYEYYPIYEWTETNRETVPAGGRLELATIRPSKPGRFVVLTRVSADQPALAADNTQITICRDGDGTESSPFLSLPTFALTLGLADEIPMFIPALTDIRLAVTSTAGEADYNVRWTYMECPLTTILRVRFGLVTRDELPEDYKTVWDRVKGGIV